MKISVIFLLLFSAWALSANIVSYVGESKKSQEEANQLALEGVAKQIKSRIVSNTELSVRESQGKHESLEKTYSKKVTVTADIALKNIRLKTLQDKSGTFAAEASVDLDQMASELLLDMNELRLTVKSQDSIIRFDMLDRDYRKMILDVQSLEKNVNLYHGKMDVLSCLQQVPPELLLEHSLGELNEFLLASLVSIKIVPEWQDSALAVTVSDFAGPVQYFPVTVTQNSRDMANGKTDEKGKIFFPRKALTVKRASGNFQVHPDLPFEFVRKADLPGVNVAYEASELSCEYRLVCDGDKMVCSALQEYLEDAGIRIGNNDKNAEIHAGIESTEKKNAAGNLTAVKLSLQLSLDKDELTAISQGVGRDGLSADVNAIQKLPNQKIQNFVKEKCSRER